MPLLSLQTHSYRCAAIKLLSVDQEIKKNGKLSNPQIIELCNIKLYLLADTGVQRKTKYGIESEMVKHCSARPCTEGIYNFYEMLCLQ